MRYVWVGRRGGGWLRYVYQHNVCILCVNCTVNMVYSRWFMTEYCKWYIHTATTTTTKEEQAEKVKMWRKRKQRWGEWESKDGEKEKVKMGRMRKWRCGERESEDGEKERVKKVRHWTMRRQRSGRASDRLCLTVVRTRDRTPISEYCQDERDVRVQ